jgi:hypothetical protein
MEIESAVPSGTPLLMDCIPGIYASARCALGDIAGYSQIQGRRYGPAEARALIRSCSSPSPSLEVKLTVET